MDSLKNAVGMGADDRQAQSNQKSQRDGLISGAGEKLHTSAGGGKGSEKNEVYLDKGVDMAQQYGPGKGNQNNDPAIERAKDEQVSDFIREQYKSKTVSDNPIKDK